MLKTVLGKMGAHYMDPVFKTKIEQELHQRYLQVLVMDLKDHVCVK